MVPNPLREALQDALRTIEPLIHEMRDALDSPAKNFHTGRIWTGPVAKIFDGELDRHNVQVQREGETILNDLRWQITRTAAEVPERQALEIIRRYDL
jgi:DNA-directed RNA polymerase subunit L